MYLLFTKHCAILDDRLICKQPLVVYSLRFFFFYRTVFWRYSLRPHKYSKYKILKIFWIMTALVSNLSILKDNSEYTCLLEVSVMMQITLLIVLTVLKIAIIWITSYLLHSETYIFNTVVKLHFLSILYSIFKCSPVFYYWPKHFRQMCIVSRIKKERLKYVTQKQVTKHFGDYVYASNIKKANLERRVV